jgi:hypothetical protein
LFDIMKSPGGQPLERWSAESRSDEGARARIGARAYSHGLVAGGPIAVSGPEEGGLEAGPLVRNRKSHFSFCALMNSRYQRLVAAVDYFNRDPVAHTWTYRLDKAA